MCFVDNGVQKNENMQLMNNNFVKRLGNSLESQNYWSAIRFMLEPGRILCQMIFAV